MTASPARPLCRVALLFAVAVLAVLAPLTVPAASFAAGSLTISPSSYDFGPVTFGTYDALHTFTVTNDADTTLTVTGVGWDPAPFYGGWTDCANNGTLVPGGSCTFLVQFAPQPADPIFDLGAFGPGLKNGSATVYWSDENGAHTTTAALSGTAVDPNAPGVAHISANPSSYDFGQHPADSLTDKTFTFTNDGAGPVTISGASTDGSPGFGTYDSPDTCTGATLAVGDSCTAKAAFAPTGANGPRTGSLGIYSDPSSAPLATVALSGTVVDPGVFFVTPGSESFGWVTIGKRSGDRTVTVTNTGEAPLALQPAAVYGSEHDQFSFVAGADHCSGTTLNHNDSCTVDVRYTPTSVGQANAQLGFSADAAANSGRVDLQGYGAEAPVTPTVSSPQNGATTNDNTPDVVVASHGLPVHLVVDDTDEGDRYADINGNATFTLSHPLADGRHTLTVYARNAAEDASATSSSTFTVDTTAPAEPAVTGGPQGTTTDATAQFEFSGEPGGAFECSLDGAAFAPCISPQTYPGLTVGQHSFRVRQTDASGHVGATSVQTFTVAGSGDNNDKPPVDATSLALVTARTGTVAHERVPVGCRLNAGRLAACTVTAAAGGHRVGRGTATFKAGQRGTVQVKLTARGQRLVHRLRGVKLTYRGVATTKSGKRLAAKTSSRVLPLQTAAIPTDGLFASGSKRLNSYGRRFVRSLAGQLAGAKHVMGTGYTDSLGRAAYNRQLGLARAQTVCAALREAGVHATLTVRSAGERHPRATNRTAAGRALNRRVELLVRYR
jgi:outer membrane protein OmpA-like peptidoglycan-associated protein